MSQSRTVVAGSQLWQVPLLIVSLAAFGYATYLFSRPGPGPSVEERIEAARSLIRFERPEPAIGVLNALLTRDRVSGPAEGEVRLLLAEAVELAQRLREVDLRENHESIVEQSRLGAFEGGRMTADRYRRWGRSLEALGRFEDAFAVYEKAIVEDPSAGPGLLRRMTEHHLRERDFAAAEGVLERFLGLTGLSDEEKAWGLGEKAELLIRRREFAAARDVLGQVLGLPVDETVRGHTAYRYGLCAWEMGDDAEAERQLRLARQLLRVRHPADAEAAYLLGRIFEKRGRADEALAFYRDVLVSHPDSRVAVLARLGRGVARIMKGDDAAGLSDLEWVAQQLEARPRWMAMHAETARESFVRAEGMLTARQRHQAALEVLALERGLWGERPPASFWARVARAYEKRAEQVELAAERVEAAAEREGLLASSRQLRVRAGDAHFSHAMALAVVDNEGYGEALLRAIELYDRASAVRSTIAALEVFTQERPSDPLAPDALLRLGRAYMVAGDFDKAIATFERNRFRYAGFVAATKSAVPLAQSLMAKGAAHFGRAERVLLELVEDNPALTPEAEDYRNALFELAALYYRQGRFEESIARFDELLKRYPDDPRRGQVLFLMGDAYRRSAGLLGQAAARQAGGAGPTVSAGGGEGLSDAERARRERLLRAGELFEQVLQHYRDRPPVRDFERSHLRLAHFYRADCAFDLGDYERAVQLYDQAAFRYHDDASALSAYVQMVNAYVALGRTEEARAVNERAKWLLRRMPAGAFSDGSFAMSRESWERWLQWSGESGMWPALAPVGPMGGVGYGSAVAGAGNAGAGVENAAGQPR